MPKQSAGILMFRRSEVGTEVFLVHPGGPFWAKKDKGAWTIPKGEFEDEDPLVAARREFTEETSFLASGDFLPLDTVTQKSGKTVHAWAVEGDCDPSQLQSNTCRVEWPPRSGRQIEVPEVDRGNWFSFDDATVYMRQEQHAFLQRLSAALQRLG